MSEIQTKICSKCRRELDSTKFYRLKDGTLYSYCHECARTQKRESYQRIRKRADGITVRKDGKLIEHKGLRTAIYWSKNMLSTLKRYYPNTKNDELVGMLGVSQRTIIRKARELGIDKDKDFLASVWEENRLLAHVCSKKKGYPGSFQKGRAFTGNQYTGKITIVK